MQNVEHANCVIIIVKVSVLCLYELFYITQHITSFFKVCTWNSLYFKIKIY